LVSGNAVHDGGVIATDDTGNLAEAVATLRVVADEPPKLVTGGSNSAASAAAAELVTGDATACTDGVNKLEQAP
jgi:hypothetical protein